jgi:DNA polymerase-3 subunit gamma/tau
MITRAAEGSARDALSLLDQAIAHGAGQASIGAEDVRLMLGLADRGRIIDLFGDVMKGRIAEALAALKDLHDRGADPAEILVELAEFVHLVTRLKLAPHADEDASITPDERARGHDFAQALSIPVLTRAWQLLSKGLRELKDAARPLAAADMVLIRLAYAADLPTPDEALRQLATGASGAAKAPQAVTPAPGPSPEPRGFGAAPQPTARAGLALAPTSEAAPAVRLSSFEDLVALAGQKRDIQMKLALERDVRLVRFEPGAIEFSQAPGASPQLAQTLMRKLHEWTGQRWMVAVSREPGAPSLKERETSTAAEAMAGVRAEPLVRRALEYFPGAEIVAVRLTDAAPESALPDKVDINEEDVGFSDEVIAETDL